MSERDGIERLDAAARRLEEIAAELARSEVDDATAVKLAQVAAEIASEAGAAAADAARAVAEQGDGSNG